MNRSLKKKSTSRCQKETLQKASMERASRKRKNTRSFWRRAGWISRAVRKTNEKLSRQRNTCRVVDAIAGRVAANRIGRVPGTCAGAAYNVIIKRERVLETQHSSGERQQHGGLASCADRREKIDTYGLVKKSTDILCPSCVKRNTRHSATRPSTIIVYKKKNVGINARCCRPDDECVIEKRLSITSWVIDPRAFVRLKRVRHCRPEHVRTPAMTSLDIDFFSVSSC